VSGTGPTNIKYYVQSTLGRDSLVEVDLQGFTRLLQVVRSNARGQAWLRQHHRLLKRRAQAVNTDAVFAGVMRGDAESQQAWGVFCDDCAELACNENKLFNRPVKLLTGPEVEHVLAHSRGVWERRAAGV
jgi:hypothetical protein